jgi:LemA protein
MWWWIIPIIIVILILWVAASYNGLIEKRNKVNNQWGQVDVQLKRRFDLIPNLVESVKGYATHEKSTFEAVTQARTQYVNAQTPADKMNANGEISGLVGRLFAVAESYPELKANANFLSLQNELSETENKISFARQFYNDTVMDYNNTVQMFPSNIFAGAFGFKIADFFKTNDSEKTVPQVKF